ncbi:spore germination protein [Bacillus paranthracis]|uniref:Spore germination protein gerha n=1 Tax=Bacillus cereus (strain Q1) TaxID=361100 RepID=B9J1D5_BACCQ|nr:MULTISPECIES: spore germination protein [Bacillus cereus group]ACM14973.1 spore germination protein gerha [Bacillus cereus Q1]MCY9249003.1 spore germination protein [Bacillus paranthracis]MDA1499777.1 spore germination protein [Bacillus cereus group sp. TH41-1LC]MDA1683784.1 spore germination protein [Bacillus cereus group sp. m2-21]MDA1696466.1 spore germination protein [Bacillus cereus group sp. m1-2]
MIWNWLRKKKKSNTTEKNETDNSEQKPNNQEDDNKEQTRSTKHNKGNNSEQKKEEHKESSQDNQQNQSNQNQQQSAKQDESSQGQQQQQQQQHSKQDISEQNQQQHSKQDNSEQDQQQHSKQNNSDQGQQQHSKQDISEQDQQQHSKQNDSEQDQQQSAKQDESSQEQQQHPKRDISEQDQQQHSKQDNSGQDQQHSKQNNSDQGQQQQNAKGNSIYDFTKPEKDRIHSLQDLIEKLKKSSDFVNYHTSDDETMPYWISYYRPSLDGEKLQKYLMPTLLERPNASLEELKEHIPMSGITITNDLQKIEDMVLKGHAIVQVNQQDQKCMLANIAIDNYRAPTPPLNESTVIGPQEGFVEDIDTNINLVRKRLPVLDLQTKEMIIGEFSKTKVVMMYLDNLAEKDNVDFLEESLRALEYDQINDSAYIQELMGEKSIFPLYINTERTDRVTKALIDGKIAIFVDGSPSVLLTPVSYFDFFISPEDYNVSWMYATFSRILRLIAVLFSICATPLYVAVLNYHYELIPSDLLETLILSRAQVPFPPLIEALFLELAIDLLREAGARLPMKVGQTLGIVGGIVIGQASVQAGLTSNILLIIVALSALASFITPIYKMGNAVRLLRFPFLIFAEIGGLFGISLGFIFLFTHLFRLTSLRKPYALFYPTRQQSVKDSWIRFPLTMIDTRDVQARPQHVKKAAKGISTKHRSDFDD